MWRIKEISFLKAIQPRLTLFSTLTVYFPLCSQLLQNPLVLFSRIADYIYNSNDLTCQAPSIPNDTGKHCFSIIRNVGAHIFHCNLNDLLLAILHL